MFDTLRKVRTYPISQTYDSCPFLFQKKDGTWLVIAHEHKNKRTVACRRDTGQVEWTSEANQPGSYFFGYSSFRCPDGTQLILMACQNGLHAMSGETGKDVWWLQQRSTGGITPCVDQQQGWVFYQCDGKVLKVRATDGEILQAATVQPPNVCISWNTVLVNDSHGYFVATRWYGKPEWDSAIRVYDKDLNLVWERTGLPVGKKDTLTYAEGRLVTGSGNHWSKKYEGDKWKYLAAYSISDGSILWKCDLSAIPYESLFNLPYFNGHFYAETTGGQYGAEQAVANPGLGRCLGRDARLRTLRSVRVLRASSPTARFSAVILARTESSSRRSQRTRRRIGRGRSAIRKPTSLPWPTNRKPALCR